MINKKKHDLTSVQQKMFVYLKSPSQSIIYAFITELLKTYCQTVEGGKRNNKK